MRRPTAASAAPWAVLAGLLAVALAVRLSGIDHGLPFVYNVDERSHFASEAVEMVVRGSLDPGYYQNPSAYTYLVYGALRLLFAGGALPAELVRDPSEVFLTARVVAALLGVAGAAATFFLARRLWDTRAGLVAAAVAGLAFLPVAYSRLALTDVGTLAPIALCVLGAVVALERGRLLDLGLAGAAAGLTAGFKYTAGLVVVAPVLAGLLRLARGRDLREVVGIGVAGLAAVAAFFVTTPFAALHAGEALAQLADQAGAAASPKLGQGGDAPLPYYLESLTWGLGWLGLVAVVGGVVVLGRSSPARAAVVCAFPVALLAYLSLQERFFGRWLLPSYALLAALAGLGVVAAADWLRARARRVRPAARSALAIAVPAALTSAVIAQPLAADLRSGAVLSRTDTRTLARQWLAGRYPPELRIVIEPEVPPSYYRAEDGTVLFRRDLERAGRARSPDYSRTLWPGLLEVYRKTGHCLVMTLGYVRGRVERDRPQPALDYYRRLEDESRVLWAADPGGADRRARPFHFDLSYNAYPAGQRLPGPAARILRLDDCRQRFGPLTPAERRMASRGGSA